MTPGGGGGGGPDGPSRAGGPSFWARGCRGNHGGCVAQPALGTAFQKVSPATRRKRWAQGVAGRGLNSAMGSRAGSVEGPVGLAGTESPGERVLEMPAPPLPFSALLDWTLLPPALWTLTPIPHRPSSLGLTSFRDFSWPRLRSCCYRPPAPSRLLHARVMVSGSVSSSSTRRRLWTLLILPPPWPPWTPPWSAFSRHRLPPSRMSHPHCPAPPSPAHPPSPPRCDGFQTCQCGIFTAHWGSLLGVQQTLQT